MAWSDYAKKKLEEYADGSRSASTIADLINNDAKDDKVDIGAPLTASGVVGYIYRENRRRKDSPDVKLLRLTDEATTAQPRPVKFKSGGTTVHKLRAARIRSITGEETPGTYKTPEPAKPKSFLARFENASTALPGEYADPDHQCLWPGCTAPHTKIRAEGEKGRLKYCAPHRVLFLADFERVPFLKRNPGLKAEFEARMKALGGIGDPLAIPTQKGRKTAANPTARPV